MHLGALLAGGMQLYGGGNAIGITVCTETCCRSLRSLLCRVLPVKRWFIEVVSKFTGALPHALNSMFSQAVLMYLPSENTLYERTIITVYHM